MRVCRAKVWRCIVLLGVNLEFAGGGFEHGAGVELWEAVLWLGYCMWD